MKTEEWFAGTGSFSKVAKAKGYDIFRIDNNSDFDLELCQDILNTRLPLGVEIFWASPPCTAFSVASISKHWIGGFRAYTPGSENALLGLKLLEHTIKNISESKPKYWFIENPRGVMRKLIDDIFRKYNITDYRRVTVSYCQYGDKRMKPTDIWTNLKGWNGRMCKNGASCHEPAPRGSKTGTQGLKNAKLRSIIPSALFEEIFAQIDKGN